MADYPLALYHVAVKRPRNVFGRLMEGQEPVNTGDTVNPFYHIPIADAKALNRGLAVGEFHFIPKYHYRTMLCVVYDTGGGVDLAASKAKEEALAAEGWVRN